MCWCRPNVRTPNCGSVECVAIAARMATAKTKDSMAQVYRADMRRIAEAMGLDDAVSDIGHILGAIDELVDTLRAEREADYSLGFHTGCVVGAAIVAWGDAMRGMLRRAPVQGDRANPPGSIDWEEHLEVYDYYAVKYGRDQSAERLAERGGFGKLEAEMLLGRPLRTWRRR